MSSMPHANSGTQPDPDTEQVILGVDTHKDVHVAALITVLGVELASAEFATTSVGYRQLLAWARGFGVLHRAGVEGTGCYGAALTRHLRHHGITVVEVNRPDRAARRRHGKPTPSMRSPRPAPYCPSGPPPPRRPPTGR